MIHPRPPALTPPQDEEWESCARCGKLQIRVWMRFDAGKSAPTVGETLTGDSSGDTGVVEKVVLEGGSYAGDDAYGTISLTSPSGIDAEGLWGTDNETLTGTTGGTAFLTLNDNGFEKRIGRLWPKDQLVFRKGKYWCEQHYRWKFYKTDLNEAKINIPDRGGIS